MDKESISRWTHEHTFGQDKVKSAEGRTLTVTIMTALTMVAEIAGGVLFGSMALLADGLHMGSHMVALGINVLVYRYARKHANDPRYCFGTGKANALGGFTGALLLATFAVVMFWESVERVLDPVAIAFDQAIIVAFLGLVVNGVSVFILNTGGHSHDDGSHHHHGHEDHNLRSAYLHVLADALTSVLAIVALLAAKYIGVNWVDPLVGVVGAVLVARWSVSLLRTSGAVLLDEQAPEDVTSAITAGLEAGGDARVTDLHVWAIAPGQLAMVATVVSEKPETPSYYKARIPDHLGLAHVSIEVLPSAP